MDESWRKSLKLGLIIFIIITLISITVLILLTMKFNQQICYLDSLKSSTNENQDYDTTLNSLSNNNCKFSLFYESNDSINISFMVNIIILMIINIILFLPLFFIKIIVNSKRKKFVFTFFIYYFVLFLLSILISSIFFAPGAGDVFLIYMLIYPAFILMFFLYFISLILFLIFSLKYYFKSTNK